MVDNQTFRSTLYLFNFSVYETQIIQLLSLQYQLYIHFVLSWYTTSHVCDPHNDEKGAQPHAKAK
jgi:hypothetical protein